MLKIIKAKKKMMLRWCSKHQRVHNLGVQHKSCRFPNQIQGEVIKTVLSQPCYCCNNSINGTNNNKKTCLACNNTGMYSENFYTFIVKDKNGQKIAIDSDTLS